MYVENNEEYNDFGVRNVNNFENKFQKPKNQKDNKFALIIAATVLFSVFNFIIGYMVGKFLNYSSQKTQEVAISQEKEVSNLDEIVGITVSDKKLDLDKTLTSKEESKDPLLDVSDLKEIKTSDFDIEGKEVGKKVSEKDVVEYLEKQQKSLKKKEDTNVKPQKAINKTETQKKISKQEVSSKQKGVIYFIQVSSNKERKYADETAKRIQQLGLRASVEEVSIGGNKYYRVKVGSFSSYNEAQSALDKIKRINSSAFLVVSKS